MAPGDSGSGELPDRLMASLASTDLAQAIETWRARGADRVEPVRFRLIEAMARRTQDCAGAARAVLEDKVRALLATHVAALTQDDVAASQPLRRPHRPLAQLVSLLDDQHPQGAAAPSPHARAPNAGTPTPPVQASLARPTELKAIRQFRSTWQRISTDQRLTTALAQVPRNAGPLNSQRLIHRTLTVMRDISPEYLERFVTYVDALGWLDDVAGSAPTPRRSKTPGA